MKTKMKKTLLVSGLLFSAASFAGLTSSAFAACTKWETTSETTCKFRAIDGECGQWETITTKVCVATD